MNYYRKNGPQIWLCFCFDPLRCTKQLNSLTSMHMFSCLGVREITLQTGCERSRVQIPALARVLCLLFCFIVIECGGVIIIIICIKFCNSFCSVNLSSIINILQNL